MSLLILYGTETGTAQDVAETIARDVILRKIRARVVSFEAYDINKLCEEKTVVFVVSTTGQGEIPPNMQPAWRWLLRRAIPKNWLDNMKCAVFGLGDSSYTKYNQAAIKLYRRILQLGAQMMIPRGLGDDQHELGLDGAFIPWREQLLCYFLENNIFPEAVFNFDNNQRLSSKYKLDYSCIYNGEVAEQDYFELEILKNERVTSEDHFQDTRLVNFGITDWDKWKYNPGDVLMIRPYNLKESVNIAIDSLGYTDEELDKKFVIVPRDEFTKVPPHYLLGDVTTLRLCFERYFDLQTIPKKSFFEILATLADDPMEKEKLQELSNPKFIDDLMDYSYRLRRTTAETLRDFPKTAKSISPEYLFDLFKSIRPRAFSIASAGDKQKNMIQLLIAKVEYRSRMSEPRRGLCSSFVARLQTGDRVFAKIRQGTFKFPPVSTPVICIGPGTGIAPFRSYLQWRNDEPSATRSVLFFGCRGREKDYYFKEEWPFFKTINIITAFSRDFDQKFYVQDHILKESEFVWNILTVQNGYCFIAGSSGDMPKGVLEILNNVAADHNWTKGKFTDSLETQGRLQFETWS